MKVVLFQTLALLASCVMAAYEGCPPDGSLLPRPRNLANSTILHNATTSLGESLDKALSGEIAAGFDVHNSSFSIGLVSFDAPTAEPIWSYHHRGDANNNGSSVVDGNTQYLVGSISKLLTDLIVLRSKMNLSDPITKYIPQLASNDSLTSWENITLDSLADHLSGMVPNYGFSEYYYLKDVWLQLGFPEIPDSDYAPCGIVGLNSACSEEQILDGMLKVHPVSSPNQRPVYSNMAFTLLCYALKEQTGKDLRALFDEYLTLPFGLNNTGVAPGNDSDAVIPPIANSWGSQYGKDDSQAPAGGYYTSLNDFSVIVQSILNKTALDTESAVRAWLKPAASSSSPYTLVGRPWEIYRSTNLTPNHPHTIDIYEKNGGAYGYTAQTGIIDQYGVGIVVFTAGPANTYRILYDALLSTILPAVEEEARVQAAKYTGIWSGGVVELNTTMDDQPGILVSGLSRNGSDILAGIQGFFGNVLPQFGNLSSEFRMFPAEVETRDVLTKDNHTVNIIREDWRIGLDFLPNTKEASGSDLPGQGAHSKFCQSWETQDWLYYGGEAVDRIVFVLEEKTRDVLNVEIPFLRADLEKSS